MAALVASGLRRAGMDPSWPAMTPCTISSVEHAARCASLPRGRLEKMPQGHMSSTFPLDPPHALAVGANLLQTHRLLLYSGQMTGRWFNVTTTRVPGPGSGGSREPVTVTEPQKDIVGVGTVTLELLPDPHLDWFFAHNGFVPLDQWPVLIPPSSLSNDFATRIGPADFHTPRVAARLYPERAE